MTRSLRLRLTLAVVIVLAAVLATFAVVVHLVLEQALVRQLDVRLAGDAAAVAGMAEDDPAGPEFEYESLPQFERQVRPSYFEEGSTGRGSSPARRRSAPTTCRRSARGPARPPSPM